MGGILYSDRREAGRSLAEKLSRYAGRKDTLVLALPRGGVPVGFEVAAALHAPLDIYLVRKVGVPGNGELAMGALASGGVRVRMDQVMRSLGLSEKDFARVAAREEEELRRRERELRADRPGLRVEGKALIVVDDGLATGATMRAALMALRNLNPAHIVAAVPVGARESCQELRGFADEVVCAATPSPFSAVGCWYGDFRPTSGDEVRELLDAAERLSAGGWHAREG